MFKVFYDEYWDDSRQACHTETFRSLQDVADHFFGLMRVDYSKEGAMQS